MPGGKPCAFSYFPGPNASSCRRALVYYSVRKKWRVCIQKVLRDWRLGMMGTRSNSESQVIYALSNEILTSIALGLVRTREEPNRMKNETLGVRRDSLLPGRVPHLV